MTAGKAIAQSSTLFVASVAKAFSVLEAFGGSRRYLSHAEISTLTGLDKSAAQRFANTLLQLGYLRKDPITRAFGLTPKALALGLSYLRAGGVAEPAAPFLREAARESDETVNLTQLDGTDIVYIGRIPSRHIISADLLVGTRYPAWCTAMGHAMLAHIDEEQARDILVRSNRIPYTAHTVTDLEQILAVIREARQAGFSFVADQIYLGDFTVAAPIFGPSHEPIAALGITGLASRHERARFQARMGRLVMDTAGAISATLGREHRLPDGIGRAANAG
jgi:DNA-binding IclR family transcriptional regulator